MIDNKFIKLFEEHMISVCNKNPDPSHDILHVKRVVENAIEIALIEKGNLEIIVPAAYLHDSLYVPKTDSRRAQASKLSADFAIELLEKWQYPEKYFQQIHHAILAHSFSANIKAKTLEAKIIQDADRLDAIGAIGTCRCILYSGLTKRKLYEENDPFCKTRTPNEKTNALDHFKVKLLNLYIRLNTKSAKEKGKQRVKTMNLFLQQLEEEIS